MYKNTIKKYRSIFILGFENALEYRGNYLINLISIVFPIMMQYFVWSAVFAGKGQGDRMFGLTYAEALIYTLCAGFISKLIGTDCHHQISQDIKNGTLNQIMRSFGEKILELIVVFVVLIIFIVGVAPNLGLIIQPFAIIAFLIVLIPAFILNFLIFLSVSMLAFWIVEVGRLYGIIDILVAIVSGAIFPLSIFGEKTSSLFEILPFTYTTYFLTNTLNGTVTIDSLGRGVLVQVLWIGIFFIICSATWNVGLKRYTAAGG